MATQNTRPGRTLAIFGAVLLLLLGLVALGQTWKPRLGLDLQGGTRVTLQAKTSDGGDVTPAKLAEAKTIITSRVNATGTTAAEVTTRGEDQIIVEVPGDTRSGIVDQVGRTAQMRFRLVWAGPASGAAQPQQPQNTEPPPGDNTGDGAGTGAGSGEGPGTGSGAGAGAGAGSGAGDGAGAGFGSGAGAGDGAVNNRAASGWMLRAEPDGNGSTDGSGNGSGSASGTGTGDGPSDGQPSEPNPPTTEQPGTPTTKQQPLDEMSLEDMIITTTTGSTPPEFTDAFADLQQDYTAFTCPDDPDAAAQVDDEPGQPLITCDDEGLKYLLSPAVIEGTNLTDASAVPPSQNPQWVVSLDLDGEGSDTFATVTRALAPDVTRPDGSVTLFAIVLDGQVLSAPSVNTPITDGNAEISGDFDQESATDLANSLKYGALPLTFVINGVDLLGPTLAGSQLSAGVLAGVIGIALVIIYCMLYYRGLGLVVVASLGVAAFMTYEMVILLGTSVGFALTLPGIAGLIVAVGITADSFIIYFERIRDEARDGKSLRLAVESGWKRARNTCLAADAVSLLAAVVLYTFAIDEVRGFAFTLGLSTVIDVIVFFFFTKPMVTLLARTEFFGQGHRFSGLDAAQLGIRGRAVTQVARTPRGAH